jgi:Xaa-Pro aminopeptidase
MRRRESCLSIRCPSVIRIPSAETKRVRSSTTTVPIRKPERKTVMNIFDERIARLQEAMKKDGIKAFVIPATDPHMSEMYAPRFGAARFYFCAFEGEDGTLLVTQDQNYLYTDGRYWTEAKMELAGTKCTLVYSGKAGVPSMSDFVKDNDLYPLGLDASLFSLSGIKVTPIGFNNWGNHGFGTNYSISTCTC